MRVEQNPGGIRKMTEHTVREEKHSIIQKT